MVPFELRGRMDCDLEVFLEGRMLRRVPLGADPVNIGRDTTNEVVLNGAAVADFHARVVARGERYLLTDLSTRGTFMRGARVVTNQINTGDEFYIGPYVFRVVPRSWSVHESAAKPPPKPAPLVRSPETAAPPSPVPAAEPPPPPPPPPAADPAPKGPGSSQPLTPAPPRRSGKTAILPPPPPPIELSALIGQLEVKPLLEALLGSTIPVFRGNRGVVMLADDGHLSPVVARSGQSSPVQESFSTVVCRRALTSAKPVLIPFLEQDANADLMELAEGCPAALMALPLIATDHVVAVLYLECDRATPSAFHDRPTLEYVTRTAGRALAAAIEHEAIAADAKKWHAERANQRKIRPLAEVLADREREHIQAMLERAGWQLADAARLLGVNRSTLQHRMRKLGIRLPQGQTSG